MKALGSNFLKALCFQGIGFKYQPAHPYSKADAFERSLNALLDDDSEDDVDEAGAPGAGAGAGAGVSGPSARVHGGGGGGGGGYDGGLDADEMAELDEARRRCRLTVFVYSVPGCVLGGAVPVDCVCV